MRSIYRLLLRLYPSKVREEFGQEMLAVFDEASAAARPAGALAYAVFCVREVAGLLMNIGRVAASEEARMASRKWVHVFGAIGFVAALVAAIQWAWTPYTSRAVLVLSPAKIPSRYAPAAEADLNFRINAISRGVLSRTNLSNLINTLNLYPSLRRRLPQEDIIETVRQDVRISRAGGDWAFDISFSYSDNLLAQRTVQRLASDMIDEYVRHRSSVALQTVDFLNDRRGRIGKQWEDSLQALRAAQAKGGPLDRLQLEAAIAGRSYEEVSAQVAEAETMKTMEERRQGPLLDVLDPASLPAGHRPEWWGIALLALAGGLGGASLGWLLARLFTAIIPTPKPSHSS